MWRWRARIGCVFLPCGFNVVDVRRVSETVQRAAFQAGALDVHGNPVDAWLPSTDVGIYAFNPGTTSEPFIPGHNRVVTQPAIYVPEGTPWGPRDRVTVRGVLYEVDGVALDYRNPYDDQMDGVQVNLKAEDG